MCRICGRFTKLWYVSRSPRDRRPDGVEGGGARLRPPDRRGAVQVEVVEGLGQGEVGRQRAGDLLPQDAVALPGEEEADALAGLDQEGAAAGGAEGVDDVIALLARWEGVRA